MFDNKKWLKLLIVSMTALLVIAPASAVTSVTKNISANRLISGADHINESFTGSSEFF